MKEIEKLRGLWKRYDTGDHIKDDELLELINSAQAGFVYLLARDESLAAAKTSMDLRTLQGWLFARRKEESDKTDEKAEDSCVCQDMLRPIDIRSLGPENAGVIARLREMILTNGCPRCGRKLAIGLVLEESPDLVIEQGDDENGKEEAKED
jgi:hypothetical protein